MPAPQDQHGSHHDASGDASEEEPPERWQSTYQDGNAGKDEEEPCGVPLDGQPGEIDPRMRVHAQILAQARSASWPAEF